MAALTGVRVVEFTNMITGPVAGCMLADLGADIVKIENPKGGDLFRTFRGGLYSPYFQSYNRNKRSLTLDLRSDKGREIAIDLVKRADILIENFRPGVMDRLGLGLEAMQKLNPKLIYCSITGFGADGPYKDRPAYDAVAQAISGLSSLFLNPEAPQITGPTISDNMTGIYACYGIMGALVERQRTGKGRLIEVNMLEATIAFFPDPWGNWTQLGIVPGPLMRVSASQSHALKCADGKLMSVHLSSQEKFWSGCCEALHCERLMADPRFDSRPKRIENYVALGAEFRKAAVTKPRAYWMERLEKNDVPFAPVHSLSEVFDDPQVQHLDTFAEMHHPTEGKITAIRRPVWIDGSRDDQPLKPAPVLGEQTDEVLAELGFGKDKIAELRKEGVV